MTASFDRFLRHRPAIHPKTALGRTFAVTRETWQLSDDPRTTRPAVEIIASGRTASEAADLAREAALSFAQNGYHKPARAWWGVEDRTFHRFTVTGAGARVAAGSAVALGLAGLAAFAFLKRRKGKSR
ncbi:hypothetical protein [Phenylobacterium deserti]|uniref:Uncharacterized protein n=1 Tax=Phenylobacterium deserti TaxID=1914756 RepID=A0A328ACX4_9CAUL|nr:hypothetical protein [Phenylobacterium deserti]RAK52519.1 hypothetical protein DJ018_09905 [Phenylobacterium deserti]